MKNKNLRIGIAAKKDFKAAEQLAIKFTNILRSLEVSIVTVAPLEYKSFKMLNINEIENNIDFIVVVGGDGTILRIMRSLGSNIPMLSIKMGGRGVMSEVNPNDLKEVAYNLINGKYIKDRRIRLCTKIKSKILHPALNEVYIKRSFPSGTPTYTIKINKSILKQRMDGILISTPTGSTGHSFSLGSPVVQEDLNVFMLTPLSSLSRFPPLIVPPKQIEIISDSSSQIIIDGQLEVDLKPKILIKISKYKHDGVFIRFKNQSFRQLFNLGFT
jgi:NAD+ kinase